MSVTKKHFRIIEDCTKAIYHFQNWRTVVRAIVSNKNPPIVVFRNGIRVCSSTDIPILDIIEEIWHKQLYTPATHRISNNDVVVDIGANIGVFSLFAAQRTRNNIYAFEPLPDNYRLLLTNVSVNSLGNIIASANAVSERSGTERLYITKNLAGNLLFDHNIHGKIQDYVEVESLSLQDLMEINRIKCIDFLKMDCEGSEFPILMGSPRDCLKRIRRMAIEFHDNVTALNHGDIEETLKCADFLVDTHWDGISPFGYLHALKK